MVDDQGIGLGLRDDRGGLGGSLGRGGLGGGGRLPGGRGGQGRDLGGGLCRGAAISAPAIAIAGAAL